MGWLGKVIGGTFGFMFGGPLGLVAGATFGHMFDSSGNTAKANEQQTFWNPGAAGSQGRINSQEQSQMVFFVGAFSMLAKIASADGTISQAERRKVDEFIMNDLRLQGQSKDAAVRIFETAGQSEGTFDQFAHQFYDVFKANRQMLTVMIDIMYRVSYADGSMIAAEEALIDRAGSIFHFQRSVMDSIRVRYGAKKSSSRSYSVLGLEASASDDEVKKAYRKMANEYHPDKISSKGLPEEFTKFASEKFREIQAAYDEIKTSRGL